MRFFVFDLVIQDQRVIEIYMIQFVIWIVLVDDFVYGLVDDFCGFEYGVGVQYVGCVSVSLVFEQVDYILVGCQVVGG